MIEKNVMEYYLLYNIFFSAFDEFPLAPRKDACLNLFVCAELEYYYMIYRKWVFKTSNTFWFFCC